jgi:hypothetical protein
MSSGDELADTIKSCAWSLAEKKALEKRLATGGDPDAAVEAGERREATFTTAELVKAVKAYVPDINKKILNSLLYRRLSDFMVRANAFHESPPLWKLSA